MNFRPALLMTSLDRSASIDTRRKEFLPGEVLLLLDCAPSSWAFCSARLRAMAVCANHLIEPGLETTLWKGRRDLAAPESLELIGTRSIDDTIC
jgi:hypothetical protein